MSHVSIRRLKKRYQDSVAVDGIDIEIESGTFVTLLGPSGCGKTTTLRCLAGLEDPTSGKIVIDGKTVADGDANSFVSPDKRRIGMVFQSYGLWPHMSVRANVAYPMKIAKTPKVDRRRKVDELLQLVQLQRFADKSAAELSGGQQQRVALARALANGSSLMLYDEPLSNLDARLRTSTRDQIRSVHDEWGTTSVYVTHDQSEALSMSDKIIVMNAGRIEQVGTPADIYERPATSFVADFLGFENLLPATVVQAFSDFAVVALADTGVELNVPLVGANPGDRIQVAFRANQIVIGTPAGTGNALSAVVERVTYYGSSCDLQLNLVGLRIVASLVNTPEYRPSAPRPGDSMEVQIPVANIIAFPNHGAKTEHVVMA